MPPDESLSECGFRGDRDQLITIVGRVIAMPGTVIAIAWNVFHQDHEGRSHHAADVGPRCGFRSGWRTIENHSKSSDPRNGGSRLCRRMHCRDYERNTNAAPRPLGPSVWHSPGNLLERKSGGGLRAGTSRGTRNRGRVRAARIMLSRSGITLSETRESLCRKSSERNLYQAERDPATIGRTEDHLAYRSVVLDRRSASVRRTQ
jgi:hypothetical protein